MEVESSRDWVSVGRVDYEEAAEVDSDAIKGAEVKRTEVRKAE